MTPSGSGEGDGRERGRPSARSPQGRGARDGTPGSRSSRPRSGSVSRSGPRSESRSESGQGRGPRTGQGRGSGSTTPSEERSRAERPALLGPRRTGPSEPRVPDDVVATDLDRSVRSELRSLSKANADEVARHLVMIGRLLPDDPEGAYAHAMAAQRRAGRVAVVREIVGVAAYRAGRWAEALSELRAARRMSGSSHVLPLMADAERGLGRPERALALAASPEAESLARADQVELAIVVSGARRDLGQVDAAVLALQIPELSSPTVRPYTPRLQYAYAEALLEAGRQDEAVDWFARAASGDPEGATDADERLAELQGLEIVDLLDGEEPAGDEPADERPADGQQGVAPRETQA